MNKYAVCVKGYEGDKFPPANFIFEANNQEEADNLAFKWAMRRGLNHRLDIIIRLAHTNELGMNIHNEYVY